MKRIMTIGMIILCLVSTRHLSGQTMADISQMRNAIPTPPEAPRYQFNKAATNELNMLFSALFLSYKSFFSSQDGSSCGFTPSCSEYMMHAIEHQGALFGMLNGFDRLNRCHGFNRQDYPIHPEKKLLVDPVEADPLVKQE